MQSAMPQLVEFLDTIRDDLDEVSPGLGVTDPVSGKLVVDNLTMAAGIRLVLPYFAFL